MMEIHLKNTLKSLRHQKNITQEALAKHLGISQQSVGKWERGEGFPDITLLPSLALFFDVTVDQLLDVGQARIEEKVKAYEDEARRLGHIGDIYAEIELMETAYREFPNNHRIMMILMQAISSKGIYPPAKEDTDRIVELGTRILKESTDPSLRENAIQCLCYAYHDMGDSEKALSFADMGGSIYTTRDALRVYILSGEEGKIEAQKHLINLLHKAAMVTSIITTKHHFPPEEEVAILQFGVDLLKMLFSDGNVGIYAFDISWKLLLIASVYAKQKDEQKTLTTLEECVKYCVMDAQNKSGMYTAPMVKGVKYKSENSSKNFKGNACNVRLDEFAWHRFDFIREHPKFKDLTDELKNYAEA